MVLMAGGESAFIAQLQILPYNSAIQSGTLIIFLVCVFVSFFVEGEDVLFSVRFCFSSSLTFLRLVLVTFICPSVSFMYTLISFTFLFSMIYESVTERGWGVVRESMRKRCLDLHD